MCVCIAGTNVFRYVGETDALPSLEHFLAETSRKLGFDVYGCISARIPGQFTGKTIKVEVDSFETWQSVLRSCRLQKLDWCEFVVHVDEADSPTLKACVRLACRSHPYDSKSLFSVCQSLASIHLNGDHCLWCKYASKLLTRQSVFICESSCVVLHVCLSFSSCVTEKCLISRDKHQDTHDHFI